MQQKPKVKVPVYLPFHAFWIRLTLLLLLVAGIYFFHSFAKPIITAFIIAIITWPAYNRLLRRLDHRDKTAATLATLAAIIFLVTPLGLLTSFTIKEVISFLGWAVNANTTGVMAPDWFGAIPWIGEWLTESWNEHLSAPGMIGEITQIFGSQNIGSLYRNVIATSGSILHILLTLTFTLITLFFLYKDGNTLIGQLDKAGEYFYQQRWFRYSRIIPVAIRSTVLGMGVIAIAEGVILGVAYWIAGFPSPVPIVHGTPAAHAPTSARAPTAAARLCPPPAAGCASASRRIRRLRPAACRRRCRAKSRRPSPIPPPRPTMPAAPATTADAVSTTLRRTR